MLCLPPIPDDYDITRPVQIYSSIATLQQKYCEPAGHSYHSFVKQRLGLSPCCSGSEPNLSASKSSKKSEEEKKEKLLREKWESENQHKISNVVQDENLYEALGLGHVGITATPQQIKKAYQKMSLIHHPDKKFASSNSLGSSDQDSDSQSSDVEKSEEQEEINQRWLLIQKAFETLSNKKTKLQYDSTFEFDDTIPSEKQLDSAFYDPLSKSGAKYFFKLFAPVFARNARFSRKSKVPSIGDNETELKQVHAFYAFWRRFDSWREFVKDDEYDEIDLQNAESREEKRWMQRKNETIRKKLKKKEYKRLEELVERAFKNDPRLVRERERVEIEKREKIEKEQKEKLEKEQKELAEKQMAEQAELKEKELAAQQKKEKQTAKKRLRKRKKALKVLVELAFTVLDTQPADKATCYEKLGDLTDAAKVEEDLIPHCEAFKGLNEETAQAPQASDLAQTGIDFLLR